MTTSAAQSILLVTIASTVLGTVLFNFNTLPTAFGQTASTTPLLPSFEATSLMGTPIFKQSEQSAVIVSPTFNDDSTNIAFYMKCPNSDCPDEGTLEAPVYIFSAENLGHGSLPFSDYWAPPLFADYLAIEYKNDEQQYTCSDKSVTECQNDPRYISSFEFSLVSDTTDITPEMLASKNVRQEVAPQSTTTSLSLAELSIGLSAPFITSDLDNGQIVTAILDNKSENTLADLSVTETTPATSDALKKLSIDLSAPSITSNLDDGQIVTAILDNKPSPLPEPETIAATSSGSVGDFILSIVDSIIDIFTPDPPPPTEPAESDPPTVSEETPAPVETETPAERSQAPEPAPPETNTPAPIYETSPTDTE